MFTESCVMFFRRPELFKRHRSTFVPPDRASRDQWDSHSFHALCNYREPTVTVVKSGDYIFGGYTERSWEGKGLFT